VAKTRIKPSLPEVKRFIDPSWPEEWKRAARTSRSVKDLPEDMRLEFFRRLAKKRAEADPSDLVEVLRLEVFWRVNVEGETATAICARAGLGPSAFSRFLSGERDLTLAVAAKLTKALDLVLVPRTKSKGKS
jgi:hypothetical protein